MSARLRHLALILGLLAGACGEPSPSPSRAPQPLPTAAPTGAPTTSPSPSTSTPGSATPNPTATASPSTAVASPSPGSPIANTDCEVLAVVECIDQVVRVDVPIAGTRFALAYASDALVAVEAVGLGGWTFSEVGTYDPSTRIVWWPGGRPRVVEPVPNGTDLLVASVDGTRVHRFDGSGRLVATQDALTGAALFTVAYDPQGRLDRIVDVDGNATVVQRDGGKPVAILAAAGDRTTVQLDADAHLARLVGPGNVTTVIRSDAGGLLSELFLGGRRTAWTYGADGLVTRVENAEHAMTTYARSPAPGGYTIQRTSPLGRVTTLRIERLADGTLKRTLTDQARGVTTVTVAADGSRVVSRPNGTTVTSTYAPDPRWGWAAPIVASQTEAWPSGVSSVRLEQQAVEFAVPGDPWSVTQLRTEVSTDGRITVATFDAAARTIIITTPDGRATVTTLDAQNRRVRVAPAGRAPTTYRYDATGRLIEIARGEGADRRVTTYAYDDVNGRIDTTDALGGIVRDQFDARGQHAWTILADGTYVVTKHGPGGDLVALTPPGRPPHAMAYDGDGRLTGYRPPAIGTLEETRWVYDPDGNLSEIVGPDGRTAASEFDGFGRLAATRLPDARLEIGYDGATGAIEELLGPYGVDLDLGWDGDLLTNERWSGAITGEVSREFGPGAQVVRETANGRPIQFQYDRDGRLASAGALTVGREAATSLPHELRLGGVTTTWTYNAFGEPVRIETSFQGTLLFTQEYSRDGLGRVTAIAETRPGTTISRGRTYDAVGRLADATDAGTKTTYAYDANGNRLGIAGPEGTVEATFDAQDRLVSTGTDTWTYDANGFLSKRTSGGASIAYRYDLRGSLLAVTPSVGPAIEYLIDGQGRRVGARLGGQTVLGLLYDDANRPIAQLDGSGNLVSRFVYVDDATTPSSMERDGATYLIVTDALGSVRLVIDGATGAIAQELDYDAFGVVTRDTNPGFQPFGFAGGLYDPLTGLVRFGARDYDPATGRWTARDPIGFAGGDTNLYRYAGGDPVNNTDVTGTGPFGTGDLCDLFDCGDPNKPPPPVPPSGVVDGNICSASGCTPCPNGNCSQDKGHPHIWTADGIHYEFQPAGEFVALVSPAGDFEVQTRQERRSRIGSGNTAVAMNVAGDRVAIYKRGTAELRINGEPFEMAPGTTRDLPKGGRIIRLATQYQVAWPDGSRVDAYVAGVILQLVVEVAEERRGKVAGLMGNHDGNPDNDLVTRDGETISVALPSSSSFNRAAYRALVYGRFADSWRVTQATSLFDYAPGESTSFFTVPGFPDEAVTVAELEAPARIAGESACRGAGVRSADALADCVLDVAVTGQPEYATAAAVMEAAVGPGDGPPVEEFDIDIGDTVDFDLPTTGGGHIDVPGEIDRYRFRAPVGQIVYLERIGPDPDPNLLYTVRDELGQLVPNGGGGLYAGGGRVVLERGGRYMLTVSGGGGAVGAYAFRLWAVPADQTFEIKVGDAVAEGQPGAGAGRIQTPGAIDRFTFQGSAGQAVYLETATACDLHLRWLLFDPGAPFARVNTDLCRDIETVPLSVAGTYTIVVQGDAAATGHYSFAVRNVPPAGRFKVKLGDTIAPGVPSAGAGRIESSGAVDEYVITLAATESLDIVTVSSPCTDLRWSLTDPAGGVVVGSAAVCPAVDTPPIVATQSGDYVLRVAGLGRATGDYSIRFVSPP